MSLVTIPNVFVPNTLAQAGQVNANFSVLANFINSGILSQAGPSGSMTLPGGIIIQWGTIANVPADGSELSSTIDFTTAFPTVCFGVIANVTLTSIGSPVASLGGIVISNFTVSGFQAITTGGSIGSTVSAFYIAIGQ
jgi:hypothetical protein